MIFVKVNEDVIINLEHVTSICLADDGIEIYLTESSDGTAVFVSLDNDKAKKFLNFLDNGPIHPDFRYKDLTK